MATIREATAEEMLQVEQPPSTEPPSIRLLIKVSPEGRLEVSGTGVTNLAIPVFLRKCANEVERKLVEG
jgi:hypothetical protein